MEVSLPRRRLSIYTENYFSAHLAFKLHAANIPLGSILDLLISLAMVARNKGDWE